MAADDFAAIARRLEDIEEEGRAPEPSVAWTPNEVWHAERKIPLPSVMWTTTDDVWDFVTHNPGVYPFLDLLILEEFHAPVARLISSYYRAQQQRQRDG
jgi:hypothetical protein